MTRDFIDAGNVEPFPQAGVAVQPSQPVAPQLEFGFVRTVNIAMSILSLRILALLALLGAIGMFSYAVIDPLPWRLYAAGAYAGVVLWPIVYLYLKRET